MNPEIVCPSPNAVKAVRGPVQFTRRVSSLVAFRRHLIFHCAIRNSAF